MKYCPVCKSDLKKELIDSKNRLKCNNPNCGYIFWNNPTPVIAALVEHDDRIVLAHNKAWPKGIFSVITGFLEKGETPEGCVLREVKEELGLTGNQNELIGVYSFLEMNQVIIADFVKAEGDIKLGDELTEIKKVEKHKLKGWSYGTGLAVTDWVNRQRPHSPS